jgi:hypothetical protein
MSETFSTLSIKPDAMVVAVVKSADGSFSAATATDDQKGAITTAIRKLMSNSGAPNPVVPSSQINSAVVPSGQNNSAVVPSGQNNSAVVPSGMPIAKEGGSRHHKKRFGLRRKAKTQRRKYKKY